MDTGKLELHRRCSPVADTIYGDEETHSPVVMIAEALAEASGTEMRALPPLNDYVDCDALERLFDTSDKAVDTMVLSFKIEQWNVFVRSDGAIRVCDATDRNGFEPIFEEQPE
ncbi:HalOD1 output domain-containing protein [Natrarchaeobaculum sulfurireducens]|uniref:Halobacterial output domain-containing protein n=1 Tax=Natrarchaeobaculum sulfurireducens TaxID=2044521 RepID=A0A346PFY9_9EURY|nr:HalOD1 output domain-containing protein [Natrarchaeobaculum sulfurireducens]AXR78434.1 hypothetical protein AArc1_2116 [Natrarchaeobaculum sulfurireducens]AXR81539.1 hypothetical protein AArcMg_1526 [Natrarchaeobaculum sulfurireducens]